MNTTFQLLVFSSMLFLPALQEESDQEKIQGIWRVIELKEDGESKLKYLPEKGWNIFVDNFMINCSGLKVSRVQNFELHPEKTPKVIIIRSGGPDSPSKTGIYQFEKNTLKMCLSSSKDDVPKSFDAPKGSGYLLAIIEKQD